MYKTKSVEDTELVYTILREQHPNKQIDIEYNYNDLEYTLKVTDQTIIVRSIANKCLSELETGATYLLSISKDSEKKYITDECHFRREFRSAKRYLDFLDERY